MATLEIDLGEVRDLALDLQQFAKRGMPYAARNVLNRQAFQARKVWSKRITDTFTLRNTWTLRTLRVVPAKTRADIFSMHSEVGSLSSYMGMQEHGGVEHGKSGARPIPTAVAAGQPMGSERTKPVRRPNRMNAIQLSKARKGGRALSKAQRNAIAVKAAASKGTKFALIEFENSGQGIAKVSGRKRITVRTVWDLSHKSQPVPREPTLGPTMDSVSRWSAGMAAHALREQLRFNRVSGY